MSDFLRVAYPKIPHVVLPGATQTGCYHCVQLEQRGLISYDNLYTLYLTYSDHLPNMLCSKIYVHFLSFNCICSHFHKGTRNVQFINSFAKYNKLFSSQNGVFSFYNYYLKQSSLLNIQFQKSSKITLKFPYYQKSPQQLKKISNL